MKIKRLITPLFLASVGILLFQTAWLIMNFEESTDQKLGEELILALNKVYHLTLLSYAFLGFILSLVLRMLIKNQKKLIIAEAISLVALVSFILLMGWA